MKKSMLLGIIGAVVVAALAVIVISRFKEEPAENVLVWVDGASITVDDFRVEWRRQLSVPGGEAMLEGVDSFLEDMITEKLFLAEARRRKIDSTERCRREVEKYREQLMIETLLNEEVLAVRQPQQVEIEKFWEENSEAFSVPELKRISHILIKPRDDETDEEVLNRCRQIMDRLAKGEDFAALAQEVSEGSSANRGGDLGYFRPGQLAPELEMQSEKLQVGEIGGPLKTSYGYHIIIVADKKPPRAKTLEESRQEVLETMRARTRKAKFEALKSQLKALSKVKKNEELLNRLRAEIGKLEQ